MARAAYAGALSIRDPGEGQTPARLVRATDATPEILADAGAYLFACPENLGAMSGEMKEFFDRAYYPLLGRIDGRAYATAIAAGSAGQGAQAQIDRIVTGWRLRRVAEPVIVCTNAQTQQEILAPKVISQASSEQCHALGASLAEGLRLGIF